MRIGVAITVNDRPEYLKQVLEAWGEVRHIDKVEFRFGVEPSRAAERAIEMITGWSLLHSVDTTIRLNPEKFGSQHNPWEVMQASFNAGCRYVILAEDDLLPSTDILEYHQWASVQPWAGVAMVCSCNREPELYPGGEWAEADARYAMVEAVTGFADCWIWGTRAFWWEHVISPTWDHNYSTGEGEQKGWDWNLNRRVMVPRGLKSLQPNVSRVQNIGAQGEHAVALESVPGWRQAIAPTRYRIVDGPTPS